MTQSQNGHYNKHSVTPESLANPKRRNLERGKINVYEPPELTDKQKNPKRYHAATVYEIVVERRKELNAAVIDEPVIESVEMQRIRANMKNTSKLLNSPTFRRISVFPEDKRDRMVNLYANGALIPELVKLFKLTEKEVRLVLSISCELYTKNCNEEKAKKAANAEASNKKKGVRHIFTDEQKSDMRKRYLSGESTTKIGEQYEVGKKTVFRVVCEFADCRAFANERVKPVLSSKKGGNND